MWLFSVQRPSFQIVKYPGHPSASGQGVGPHYDAGFLTFVCTTLDRVNLFMTS